MEHNETVHAEHHGGSKNEVRNVTIVLTVLTIIELILGFMMIKMADGSTAKFSTKMVICVLMVAKAYYIVGYFMHLKHELRNLIMTIVVPLALFVWFITAFLWDGSSFKNLRNTYDPHFKEQSSIKIEKKEHGAHGEGSEHKATDKEVKHGE